MRPTVLRFAVALVLACGALALGACAPGPPPQPVPPAVPTAS